MKVKSLMAVMILSMSLFMGACSLFGSKDNSDKDTSILDSVGNVFSSIKRCEYLDEDGAKSVMHIKGDEIYVEADAATANPEELDTEGLVTGDKMYMWSKTTREGIYFNLATLTEEDVVEMKGEVIRSAKDMISFLEKEGMNCEKSEISADKFKLPTDVNFMSFEDLMQGFADSFGDVMDFSDELDYEVVE